MKWLLILLTAFVPYAYAKQPTYVRADTYYVNWGALTRGRLTPDRLRESPMIKMSILDPNETLAFTRWLRIDQMLTVRDASTRSGDPRLVIDLWDERGERTSYYSDGRFLVSSDLTSYRKVDRKFLERFTYARRW